MDEASSAGEATKPMTRWWVAAILVATGAMIPSAAGAHGPPSPEAYRWVTAPSGIQSAGEPESARAAYPPAMFAGGFSTAWTPDLQASVLLTVPDGATPSEADVTIEPLDPRSLAPALSDFDPNGNAYRVAVDGDGWQPDVRVQLTTPYPATRIWVLEADGWRPLAAQILDSGEAHADIPATGKGVTVVASWNPPSHRWWQRLTHSPRTLAIVALGAGAAGWVIGSRRGDRRSRGRSRP